MPRRSPGDGTRNPDVVWSAVEVCHGTVHLGEIGKVHLKV